MVGHSPLEAGILVRIQVPQPDMKNLIIGIITGLCILIIWHFLLRNFVAKKVKPASKKLIDNVRASRFVKILSLLKDHTRGITKDIPDFAANEQIDNDKGCFFYRVDILENQRIKSLSFTLESKSKYWRAGFKIYSPNGNFQPLGDVKEGILFHLAHPSDQKGRMWLLTRTASKTFKRYIDLAKTYRLEMFINKNNFMKCLVNGEKCFEGRINPINLENARLCAWADHENEQPSEFKNFFQLVVRKFQVKFSDIRYTTSI